jgi:hypothetical protein
MAQQQVVSAFAASMFLCVSFSSHSASAVVVVVVAVTDDSAVAFVVNFHSAVVIRNDLNIRAEVLDDEIEVLEDLFVVFVSLLFSRAL